MRSPIPTILALSLALVTVHAEEKSAETPAPFEGLKTFPISGSDSPSAAKLSYDAGLTKVIDKPLEIEGQDDSGITRLVSTRLDRESKATFLIDFDPGPSADPAFIITEEKTGKRLGAIGTDALSLPGNGFIYASGRSNNMHVERQKFAVLKGELVEIKQPFSYVGLDTKAKVPLALLSGKDSGEIVARIPAGHPLQVVLRDGEYLLIKTPFGLLGWWKMKTDAMEANAEIEGIYYAGD